MSRRARRGTAEVMSGNIAGDWIVEDVQNGWHLQAWFELRDGAPTIVELRVRSAGGSALENAHGPEGPKMEYPYVAGREVPIGGITSDVLRLSLTSLHDAIGKDNASAGTLAAHGID